MTRALLALAIASLCFASGCTICPGGILVKDNMTASTARSDAMACSYQGHNCTSEIEKKTIRKADTDRWEREAMARCMRERGYLWIPEQLMLHPDAPNAPNASANSCQSCSSQQSGSHASE